jgi:hypothetical protein
MATKKTARTARPKKAAATAAPKKTAKNEAAHNHNVPLQQKLKQKDWDPLQESIQILEQYEEGTPKREPGKDYWGACCLESQDVDVAQKPHDHKLPQEKKNAPMKPPIPK